MNSKIEKIICDDSQNITKWYDEDNIVLSIVKPPYITDEELNDAYLTKFRNIMKEIVQVTKPGGICCLILDEDKNSNQKMSAIPNKIMLHGINLENSKDWEKQEEIIWVRSSKSSTEDLNSLESGIWINFEETPFSTIHVLQRKGSEFEYVNGEERASKLDIDEKTKEAWSDSVWFVQPKRNKKFRDSLPVEIVTRLIKIFSSEGDLILDPFAEYGLTGVICKNQSRNFICIESDTKKSKIASDRINL